MSKIDVVFCFDEKLWMQAGVAITSLLCSSHDKCSYNIYCIIPSSVIEVFQNDLKKIVKENDDNSQIYFIKESGNFANSYISRHLSQATYYRLKIHELLPNLNKVIYCDVDIVFCKDLIEMNNIDIGDNLIGAVLDNDLLDVNVFNNWYNKNLRNKLNFDLKLLYGCSVNAGILIMNLEKIRKESVPNKWDELLKYKFFLHDQDILNISCYKKIKYINPKYNVLVHTLNKIQCINGEYKGEVEYAVNNPSIIHYTSAEKPWLCKPNKFFEFWWYMASKTCFYESLSLNYLDLNLKNSVRSSCDFIKNKYYLFGFMPILTSKYYNNKVKYYLFGCILILKMRRRNG